jgi:hypothetical protein
MSLPGAHVEDAGGEHRRPDRVGAQEPRLIEPNRRHRRAAGDAPTLLTSNGNSRPESQTTKQAHTLDQSHGKMIRKTWSAEDRARNSDGQICTPNVGDNYTSRVVNRSMRVRCLLTPEELLQTLWRRGCRRQHVPSCRECCSSLGSTSESPLQPARAATPSKPPRTAKSRCGPSRASLRSQRLRGGQAACVLPW